MEITVILHSYWLNDGLIPAGVRNRIFFMGNDRFLFCLFSTSRIHFLHIPEGTGIGPVDGQHSAQLISGTSIIIRMYIEQCQQQMTFQKIHIR